MNNCWSKEVPREEGWYWCKYRGLTRAHICPCEVTWFDEKWYVRTARSDTFTFNTPGPIWFGPMIDPPPAS